MIRRPIEPRRHLKSMLGALALSAALGLTTSAWAQEDATLTVSFQGIKTPTGSIMLSLAAGEEAYGGKGAPAGQAMVAVSGATAVASFAGLKPGLYAVRAFHDVNGDGKMGANPFGIPTEPYAFSNNAKGVMGPAKWSEASFEVKAGANTQTIAID